jgi:hypothetical protein
MSTDSRRFAFYGRVSTEDQQDPESSSGMAAQEEPRADRAPKR